MLLKRSDIIRPDDTIDHNDAAGTYNTMKNVGRKGIDIAKSEGMNNFKR